MDYTARSVQVWIAVLFVLLLGHSIGKAGTPGSFRGVLVQGANTKPGWIYVQSRHDMLRLVRIKGAGVHYSEKIPALLRRRNPAESLQPGVEVRVTAHEDGHGHWHAEQIEILDFGPARSAENHTNP